MKNRIMNTTLTDSQIALYYLGQECFLFQWKETFILIDAYLSDFCDPKDPDAAPDAFRCYPAPIEIADLDFVDYVFCTHPHEDHADPRTLAALNRTNAKAVYIVPYNTRDILLSCSIPEDRIRCVDGDEKLTFDSFSVQVIPAAHEQLSRDANGHFEALGYKFTFGDITLYHAGDCCIYDGLEERITGTDLGLLPINGRDYYRNQQNIIGNMDTLEALQLAENTGISMIVPMHFDLYKWNGASPAYFVEQLYRFHPGQKFHIFMPGERYIYSKE